MPIGAFTGSFDLPLLLVILFVCFFGAVVFYLRQEDKREGYPLVSSRTDKSDGRVEVVGFPPMPTPKTFHRPHGRAPVTVPRAGDRSPVPELLHPGSPAGIPVDGGRGRLGDSLGPGSWVERDDLPDQRFDGSPVYRALRDATDFHIMKGETDPRGFTVLGCDKAPAGTVVDVWVDTSEHFAKFLEVELAPGLAPAGRQDAATSRAAGDGNVVGLAIVDTVTETPIGLVETVSIREIVAEPDAAGGDGTGGGTGDRAPRAGSILLPMEFAAVNASSRTVRTATITGAQFADVPRRRRDLVITAREENRLRGYYGGGYLWATPSRTEPLL